MDFVLHEGYTKFHMYLMDLIFVKVYMKMHKIFMKAYLQVW